MRRYIDVLALKDEENQLKLSQNCFCLVQVLISELSE